MVLSLGLLATGQPAEHVLHGWPRLLGPYGNLHTHAAVMAVVASTALPWAALRRERVPALVGVGAALCLLATWVRGGWLWLGLALFGVLVARRRVGAAVGLVLVGLVVVLGVGPVRERWSDLVALFGGTPPPGGWGALGSWRGAIWTSSLSTWLAGPWPEVALGRGLGGQYGLHRHLDPHSDWLSLLFQLGPLGLLAWLAWMGTALVGLLRRSADPLAAVAFGVLGGAVVVAAVGNDWSTRPKPVLWTLGLAGMALSRSRAPGPGSSPTPRPDRRADPPAPPAGGPTGTPAPPAA